MLRRFSAYLILVAMLGVLFTAACRHVIPDRPRPKDSGWLESVCPDPSNTKKKRVLVAGQRILCAHGNRRGYPRWIFQASERIVSTPKPGLGDALFISSLDRTLYAIDTNGNKKWSFQTADLVVSSPAATPDGTVYIAAKNGMLYAVDRGGASKWKPPYDAVHKITSSPKVSTDNTIFIATHAAKLLAISEYRTKKWEYEGTDSFVKSTPEFSTDSLTIYIGSKDGYLHAVRTTDNLPNTQERHRWRKKVCDKITASPAVGPDDTIYLGCWNGKVLAIRPNGSIKWSFRTGKPILATPRIGPDQTIYVGSDSMWFYAIRNGKCKWRFRTGIYKKGTPKSEEDKDTVEDGTNIDTCDAQIPPETDPKFYVVKGSPAYIQASAALSSKNIIYFGSINENLYAVSRQGNLLWSFDAQGWVDNAPIIWTDGTKESLFVAAGSRLYSMNP